MTVHFVVLGHRETDGKLVSRVFRSTQRWVSAENTLVGYMRRVYGVDPAHWDVDWNMLEDIAVCRYDGVEYTCMPVGRRK